MRDSKRKTLDKERLRTFAASSYDKFIDELKTTSIEIDKIFYKSLFDISIRNNNLELSEWILSNKYVEINSPYNLCDGSLRSYQNISHIKEESDFPILSTYKHLCISEFIDRFVSLKIRDFKKMDDFLYNLEVGDKSVYMNMLYHKTIYKYPDLYDHIKVELRDNSLSKILEEE